MTDKIGYVKQLSQSHTTSDTKPDMKDQVELAETNSKLPEGLEVALSGLLHLTLYRWMIQKSKRTDNGEESTR